MILVVSWNIILNECCVLGCCTNYERKLLRKWIFQEDKCVDFIANDTISVWWLCCVDRLQTNIMYQKLDNGSKLIKSYIWSYAYKLFWTTSLVVPAWTKLQVKKKEYDWEFCDRFQQSRGKFFIYIFKTFVKVLEKKLNICHPNR